MTTRTDDRHRERDVTAQTLEALLHAITNRLTEVTIAKVKGRQGRKGTRHWTPPAGQPMSTKALDPTSVVDPQQWRAQVEQAAWQVLGPAGVATGNRLRQKLATAGVQPATTQTVPPEQAPLNQVTPPQQPPPPPPGGGGDGADAHPIRDYAIYKAVRWLGDAGASKAQELHDKIAAAEQADIDKRTANAIEQVRARALTEGSSVEPIVSAIRQWQTGPDGDTGLASWARTRAEAATTATVQGVHHGLLANLPPNVTVTRTWRTRLDDRVRHAHALAEGQTVEGEEPFVVGGEALRYPGDPLGSPGNVINCRCHAPYRIEVHPETKDKVATAAGATFYGEPIGSPIAAHHRHGAHRTAARPGTLPGNIDAVGWGEDHEASLAEVRPFLLSGLGGRDDQGQHPEGHPSRLPNPAINVDTVQGQETVQAKQEVAAELASRMTAVSDEDLLNCRVGGLMSDLRTANDPSVIWMRNRRSGIWQPQEPDPELYAAITEGRWDDVAEQTSIQIGDRAIKPYVGEPHESYAVGGPDMVRRLREQAVSDLIGKWAETSNDHSGWSLAIQQIIADEFGVEDAAPWEVDADHVEGRDDVIKSHGAALRAFVHAQYQATQDRLEQHGIDTLNLYRGMHWDNADDAPEWAKGSADTLEIPLRPAASFTANGETATFFAKVGGTVGQDPGASLIMSAAVPRERILATPRTGVGCLGEWEFVVLGGTGTFSVVTEGLGDNEGPLSDHDLGWMPVGTFDDGEVLRALTLKPSDARRRELLKRAGDLGIQMKALPTGDPTGDTDPPPAEPTADDVRNEDWLKTIGWDVRDWNEQPVTTLAVLAARLGTDEDGAKQWLVTMPAGEAAPKALRREAGLKSKRETKAFDPHKHPRGVHGHWASIPTLTTEDFEGRTGDPTHITRVQRGTIPTAELADLRGVKGEVPGEHRNRQGARWQEFLDDVRKNGITTPIFVTVDHGEDPKISEGNHRRDAAVELGLPEVPVHVRYFGHAEQGPEPKKLRGTVQIGDIVRARSGRLYRVNDAMIPLSGGHLREQRIYDVTDLETGMVNAFDGTEIEKLSKRDADAARAKYDVKGRAGMGGFDEEIKAAGTLAHEAWTTEEEAKHPRGVHGRFAHTWLHVMSSHTSRNPAQVVADVLQPAPAEQQLTWRKYLDGYATEDGDYFIERRISGNRLYVRDPAGDDIVDGPFPKGRVVGTGSVADLRAKAEEHAAAAVPAAPDTPAAPTEEQRVAALAHFTEQGPGYDRAVAEDLARYRNEKRKGPNDQTYAEHWLDQAEKSAARAVHSEQGGRGDGSTVRGDSREQLAEGRAGGVRGDQGQAGVLPGDRGGSPTADRPGGDGERRVGAEGRADGGPAEPGAGGPDDRGGDRGAGVADPGGAGGRDAGPGERVAAASDADTGRGGAQAGGAGLPGGEGRADDAASVSGLVTEADQPEADPAQVPNATGEDFKPESIDDLSPAGKVAKLNANMAALRTLRALQSEHRREATPEEQATLAKWSGWGGLPAVFDPTLKDYEKFAPQRDELARLLSPKEILEAKRNTLNAHYTDARVVEQIWKAVGELGFDGGRVLEPGSGSGTFIGFSPEHAAMVGVELDSTTAAISQYLYPSAAIRNESFADTNVPDGSFDATVGNVPFGDFALTDRRHNRTGESIHNHFILKSLALTRPGGIVAVLTSRHTLDSAGDRARKLMADKADLIGAIRLPTGSHQRASETGVIEDILIFRVRLPGEEPQADQSWVHSTRRDVNGFRIAVNDYWQDHPDHVLGDMTAEAGEHGSGEILVKGDRGFADLPAAMDSLVTQAKADGLTATPSDREALPELVTPEAGRHEGHIRAEADGTFTQAVSGASRPHAVPSTQVDELQQLIGLRDNLAALLSAEAATKEDTPQIEALRHSLNARYDAYVEQFGPIKRFKFGKANVKTGTQARNRPPQGGFRSDPMSAAVRALEDYDPVTGTATKADIFTKRAVAPRELKTTADNPRDALTLSMETYGDVNLPAIAKMLDTDEADARRQLGDLVFEQPPLTDEEQAAAEAVLSAERLGDIAAADAVDLSSVGESVREAGRIEPAAEYLSGNVRRKLAAARAAAAHDPRFKVNVAALERVIPPDLGPDEIDGRLGASWIGPDVIEEFLRQILNARQDQYRPNKKVMVAHSGGSIWTVVGPRQGTLATQTWGTPDLPAPALVARLLEQRPITVTREVTMPDGTTKDLPDAEATLAAQAKAQELQDRFSEWLWENPDRSRRLAATYNDRFNAIVLRKYEADPDRVFPGLSEEWARPGKMLPHVKTAAERIVQEPTVLLAHVVGAGKTAEMAMGTQELRRLGLARKPAIVIPNHLLEQFSREYLEIYPNAKILIAGKDDVDGPKRREFVARAATGDWDAVIMTRSAFERIPMSSDQTQAYIDREMATMRRQLEEAQAVSDQNQAQKRTVKKMEKAIVRAEEKLKKLLDREKDAGVSFEQTGIDYLMVDEAHDYSNLRTLSNIMGAGTDGSGMATDLHMKMEYLRAHNASGRVATFASGTPIRNTVTQAYIMQRFLRPDLLEDAGIFSFDQWAATFGQVVDEMELKPEGKGFRQTQRFAKFRNVPELLKMFHTTADVKMAEDLNLKTPKLAGGKMEIVDVPASDELRAYIEELGERAGAVRAREVEPEEDNMLKISTDGRKAALSMKLVGQEHQPGKIEAAADRIAAIHEANKDRRYGDDPIPGALQIVFLDFGTPQDDEWNAYEHLKSELVARGMDPDTIRFVQDAKNDAEKAEMFAAAKNGRINVLIGSTATMGTGTNVQKRAIALHHLDAPWRPSDVEQRDGRIMRQGNMHMEMDVPVQVIRYVTVPSFDTYMWQTLTRKAKFIHQIMRGKLDVREIDDIGDQALDYAEVMAVSTGDPNMLEKARLDEQVTKLERLERAHGRQQTNMRAESARLEEAIPQWQQTADQYDAAIAKRQDTRGDAFAMTIDGEVHGTRVAAGKALLDHLDAWAEHAGYYSRDPHPVGNVGGHTVVADIRHDYRTGGRVIQLRFADVPGDPVAEIPVSKLGQVNGAGTITRLENALYALESRRDRLHEAVATGHDERRRLQERIGMPFPQATPLHEARVRQAQLVEAMQAEMADTGAGERPEPEPTSTPPAHVVTGLGVATGGRVRGAIYRQDQGEDVPAGIEMWQATVPGSEHPAWLAFHDGKYVAHSLDRAALLQELDWYRSHDMLPA